MNWSLRARVAAATGIALVLLASIGALCYSSLEKLLRATDDVQRTQDVLKVTEQLLLSVLDVETSHRGYVLSGDAEYLEPLQASRANVPPALGRLRLLTADNASQQRRLDALTPLLSAKLDWSNKIVRLRREEGFQAALRAFETNRGKALTEQIRFVLGEVRSEEVSLLAERRERSRGDARRTARALAFLALVAVISLVGWSALIDRNIRRRERAEAVMRESEQRLAGLLDAAPDPIIISAEDGRITLANAEAEKVFGYAKEELLGRAAEGLIPDRRRARRKDGSEFPADITLSPMKTASGVVSIAIVRDITEQKAVQEALEASQERLDRALSSAKMGAWELDLRTDVCVRTLRHDQIFGYEALQPDWGLAKFIDLHVEDEHRPIVDRAFAEAGEGAGAFRLECPFTRKDGAKRWLLAEGSMRRDDEGKPARMMGVITDITDEKAREAALAVVVAELENANKELETFSYSVSHDLRAPLRSIDGFSQAVMEDCAGTLPEASVQDLGRVRAATQRMAELIDDMLELSRVSRAEIRRERVDLTAAAEAISAELRLGAPGRAVEFSAAPNLYATGDARLLRLVLANLIENAWKFTSKTPRARVEFSRFRQPDGVEAFCVRDNGAGFDAAYAHKLFGVFQRLHTIGEFPGTGVGLATCLRVIRRHGGRMWAEGAPGRGATFYFTV